MKLTILGGGGFRVPLVYKALLADESPRRVSQLRLFDTDPDRLDAIVSVLNEIAAAWPVTPTLSATTDLAEALSDTDFVFSAIRVGGTEGRALDESIALSHDVIGQETVGVGGISYALRGIPQVVRIADAIATHAPNAWVINFTNPAAVMTEVMQRRLGNKVIGICDSPLGMARRVVDVLKRAGLIEPDVPRVDSGSKRIHLEYAGLNHLGWLSGLHIDGVDVLPLLLDRCDLIESFEEGRLFGAPLIQALRAIPNEYLHYYYFSRDNLAVDKVSDMTRGKFLARQQRRFYGHWDEPGATSLERWEATRLEREETYMATNREAAGDFSRDTADLETGGYDKVALAIMHAIANDVGVELILNVANQGCLPDLDDQAVVEVPCWVDASGVTPLPATLPDHGRGQVINAKYVERRTIAAALTKSRQDALLAISHHPLVDSFDLASRLLTDLTTAFGEDLAYLR